MWNSEQSQDRPPYGYRDLPVDPKRDGEKDELSITSYYEGLSQFVMGCETPMTIAVQGDWGSGKTTALNFVRNLLSDTAKSIEFNTWLYSQFDMGDMLVFSMAHEIVYPISKSSTTAKKLMRFVSTLGDGVIKGGADALGAITGTSRLTAAVMESFQNASYSDEAPNLISKLKEVHGDFSKAVAEYCEENNIDRVVIFIDDLDRIDPERAIEILESLKLFFEVPQCVFVLALDFEVVYRGVQIKYGKDLSAKKARQFFDKIIQVPFSMPIGAFEVAGFIKDALLRAGLKSGDDDSSMRKYLKFVQHSVGNNPRSLKRLLNSYELLQLILESSNRSLSAAENDRLPILIFALQCAQAAYPEFHRHLVESRNDERDVRALFPEYEDEEELAFPGIDDYNIDPSDFSAFKRFVDLLRAESDDDDGYLDVELLQEALDLSQVTSVGAGSQTDVDRDIFVGVDDIAYTVRENSSEHTSDLLQDLWKALGPELVDGRQACMIHLNQGQRINLYSHGDPDHVLDIPKKDRPRFAGITYTRRGLKLVFGKYRTVQAEDDLFGALVSELAEKYGDVEDGATPVFRERNTGYPFMLDNIQDKSHLDDVVKVIVKVYDLAVSAR